MASSLLLSTSALLFALPANPGFAAKSTPYDPFMEPVRRVIGRLNGREQSMHRVQLLLSICHDFRYIFSNPYVAASPRQTEDRRAGDCKDKSLWLIAQLNDISIRYVIGKLTRDARIKHAWVLWTDGDHWWILDPALRKSPIRADRVSTGQYIPYYSYGRGGTRRHVPVTTAKHDANRRAHATEAPDWRRFY